MLSSVVLLLAIFFLAFIGVSPSPNAITIVLLLTCLHLHTENGVTSRGKSFFDGWLVCTAGVAFAHILPSIHALSTLSISILVLLVISGVTSFLSIGAIYIDIRIARPRTSFWDVTFFPGLWATMWGLISLVSPVGRLVTWSPVAGNSSYQWLSQYAGPWGIDFIVAAWSILLAEIASKALIAEEPSQPDLLIRIGDGDDSLEQNQDKDHPSMSLPFYILSALLISLIIPSCFIPTSPLPIFTSETTPITVGCALPQTRLPNGTFSPATIDDYIAESRKLTAAKIIIWPESALKFETLSDQKSALAHIQDTFLNGQQGLYLGISFEELDSSPESSRTSKRRNGFALLHHTDGTVLKYYKRNLVPIAESFSMTPGTEFPSIYNIQLQAPHGTRKTDWDPSPNHTRPISVTASICLDFATPSSFTPLDSRASLILAPARTWHQSVGLAMWKQARQRSHETGSTIVWCDGGEGGVSGIIGQGFEEPIQVGEGSWARTVGLNHPINTNRTVFMFLGDIGAMFFILVASGSGLARSMLLRHLRIPDYSAIVNHSQEAFGKVKRFIEAWKERGRIGAGSELERGEQRPFD